MTDRQSLPEIIEVNGRAFRPSPVDTTRAKHAPVMVAVDLGNTNLRGVLAYVDEKGELQFIEVLIPHAFIEMSELEFDRATNQRRMGRSSRQHTQTFRIRVGGAHKDSEWKYVRVGQQAMLDSRNKPYRGSSKYTKGVLDALLSAVLMELFPKHLFPKGWDNIILAVGIPPTQYQYNELVTKLLTGKHTVVDTDGDKRTFNCRTGLPYDEAGGGVARYLKVASSRDPATGQFIRRRIEPGDRILIFDAGGVQGVMAEATVESNGDIIVNWEGAKPVDGGIVFVRDAIRDSLLQTYPDEFRATQVSDLDDAYIDRIIAQRTLVIAGNKDNPEDMTDIINQSMGYLAEVRRAWTSFGRGVRFDAVLLTGGTIHTLYDFITEELSENSNLVPVDSLTGIHMANVRGAIDILLARASEEQILPLLFQMAIEGVAPPASVTSRWEMYDGSWC